MLLAQQAVRGKGSTGTLSIPLYPLCRPHKVGLARAADACCVDGNDDFAWLEAGESLDVFEAWFCFGDILYRS